MHLGGEGKEEKREEKQGEVIVGHSSCSTCLIAPIEGWDRIRYLVDRASVGTLWTEDNARLVRHGNSTCLHRDRTDREIKRITQTGCVDEPVELWLRVIYDTDTHNLHTYLSGCPIYNFCFRFCFILLSTAFKYSVVVA